MKGCAILIFNHATLFFWKPIINTVDQYSTLIIDEFKTYAYLAIAKIMKMATLMFELGHWVGKNSFVKLILEAVAKKMQLILLKYNEL